MKVDFETAGQYEMYVRMHRRCRYIDFEIFGAGAEGWQNDSLVQKTKDKPQ